MKNMKLIIISAIILAVLVAGAVLVISGCKKIDPPMSGGRTEYDGKGYPKTIKSEEITEFTWEFNNMNPITPYTNAKVSVKVADDGSINCAVTGLTYIEDIDISFTGDSQLLKDLDKAIKNNKLPEKNGTGGKTAGLPPDIGENIKVKYKSDEELYISDNSRDVTSDGFKEDAMRALEAAALRAGTQLCTPTGITYAQSASYAQGCYGVTVKKTVGNENITLSVNYIEDSGERVEYEKTFTDRDIWEGITEFDVLKPKCDPVEEKNGDLFVTDETTRSITLYYPCGAYADGDSIPEGFADYMLETAKTYK